MTRTRAAVACRALVWAAASFSACSSARPIGDPIAVLPADTAAIVEVDLGALRRDKLLDRLAIAAPTRETPAELRHRCGFDPFAGLSTLTFASDVAGLRTGDFVVVARAGAQPVDGARLVECARRLAADRGRSLEESSVAHYTVWGEGTRADALGWALAVPDPRTIVTGSATQVRRLLGIAAGGAGGLPRNAPILALRDRVGPLRGIRLVTRLPEHWADTAELPPAWASLRALRAVGATVELDGGLAIAVHGEAATAADATSLGGAAREGIAGLRRRVPLAFAPFFNGATVEAHDAEIVAGLRLTAQQTAQLFDQLDLLTAPEGGGAAPAHP